MTSLFQSMRDEKAKLRTALRLATDALGFYADPDGYQFKTTAARITPVVMRDNGDKARMTLQDLSEFLDETQRQKLRRYHLMSGE